MKSIQTKQRSGKKMLLISILLIVAASLAALAMSGFFRNGTTTPSTDTRTSTDGQTTLEDTTKPTDTIDKTPVNNQPVDNSPQESNLTANITASNQNGNTVQIRILIDGVFSSGTCTITLVKDNDTVTKTAGIQPLASASTCEGFNIPTAELSPGNWQFTVDIAIQESKATLKGNVSVK